MRFILDSNEYIFAFGSGRKPACEKLLNKLIETGSVSLRICRLIIDEVRGKLNPAAFKECITAINILTTIDEDFIVPDTISFKYESMGLKPADAFIAAYAELVKADILVSENRHFLARHGSLPFKVLTAAKTLRLL